MTRRYMPVLDGNQWSVAEVIQGQQTAGLATVAQASDESCAWEIARLCEQSYAAGMRDRVGNASRN